uniref:Uncharacterized protein n=1 Tax=Knipowitschia caucasica TaxID=637954 RepID=A0AAV2KU72_KNICA
MLTLCATYLEECPKEPYIPIYLVVMGAVILETFGLIVILLICLPSAKPQNPRRRDHLPLPPRPLLRLDLPHLLLCLLLVHCWVYEPNYVKNGTMADSTYCHKTVYLFTFWTTTLVYILLGVYVSGICCVFICSVLICISQSSNPDPEDQS